MKYCSNCGSVLADHDTNCQACGAKVSPALSGKIPGVLVTLCTITIIGSILGIVRGLLYDFIANVADNDNYWRGYAYSVVNVGTLAGAILMLNRKMIGLIMYAVFQMSYLALIVLTVSVYTETFKGINDSFATNSFTVFIASLFFIPSAVCLILNLTLTRKHLK